MNNCQQCDGGGSYPPQTRQVCDRCLGSPSFKERGGERRGYPCDGVNAYRRVKAEGGLGRGGGDRRRSPDPYVRSS